MLVLFLVKNVYHEQILNFVRCFSALTEIIMFFFLPIILNVVYSIDLVSHIEPSLHSRNKFLLGYAI